MGGETGRHLRGGHPPRGPSPRGRGNLRYEISFEGKIRSIPAWAGKPAVTSERRPAMSVHPRVGGETRAGGALCGLGGGPSPRGRGNRYRAAPRNPLYGSIPAWAGKPQRRARYKRHCRVHPRVGGETRRNASHASSAWGPSPRGRGNLRALAWGAVEDGSIPAWAGKPSGIRLSTRAAPNRVHPRVGGETAGREITDVVRSAIRVHPRVGGETKQTSTWQIYTWGPSPRGRGNPGDDAERQRAHRSIPAWAGKPSPPATSRGSTGVHPRVGGETDESAIKADLKTGPSPRGRGNPQRRFAAVGRDGSIPAWAGKPTHPNRSADHPGVHPRVGGETYLWPDHDPNEKGPSPRGRGNHFSGAVGPVPDGSIPAWAGKPAAD